MEGWKEGSRGFHSPPKEENNQSSWTVDPYVAESLLFHAAASSPVELSYSHYTSALATLNIDASRNGQNGRTIAVSTQGFSSEIAPLN